MRVAFCLPFVSLSGGRPFIGPIRFLRSIFLPVATSDHLPLRVLFFFEVNCSAISTWGAPLRLGGNWNMLTPPPPVPGDNWPVNRRGLVRKFINVFAGFFQLVGLLLNES